MKFSILYKLSASVSAVALASSGAPVAFAEENDSIPSNVVQRIADENALSPAFSVGKSG